MEFSMVEQNKNSGISKEDAAVRTMQKVVKILGVLIFLTTCGLGYGIYWKMQQKEAASTTAAEETSVPYVPQADTPDHTATSASGAIAAGALMPKAIAGAQDIAPKAGNWSLNVPDAFTQTAAVNVQGRFAYVEGTETGVPVIYIIDLQQGTVHGRMALR
jgi:preprotein translocase subunit SecG